SSFAHQLPTVEFFEDKDHVAGTASARAPAIVSGLLALIRHTLRPGCRVRTGEEFGLHDFAHDSGLLESQLSHAKIHSISANTVEDQVGRRVVTDDDHQMHKVACWERVSSGELREYPAARDLVLIG